MLGLRCGGCLGARLSRFFMISDGSLMRGMRGLSGDCPTLTGSGDLGSGAGDLGEPAGPVKEPGCHTHLHKPFL